MVDFRDVFLAKAEESLAGAISEFVNGRYNNCVNRCYYACFQAAIAGLLDAGIRPSGTTEWGHAFVQSQFAGQLVNRRKIYPATLRDTLSRLSILRRTADYETSVVSQKEASRALRRAREFVEAIREKDGEAQ